MSEMWYEVSYYDTLSPQINPVEIDRHTESCVWIYGRKYAKKSDWKCYFKTTEEGTDLIIKCLQEGIDLHQKRIDAYKKELSKWQGETDV
jgi:hypothetical protein